MNHPPHSNSGKVARNEPCPCQSGKKYKACCLNKTSASAPQDPAAEALRQAWQAVARKDPAGAAHWFQEAVGRDPENPEALAGLGQALCWQHRKGDGLEHLGRAAARIESSLRNKGDLRFALELAGQLNHWGDLGTSLRLTELALTLDPLNPVALNNHALSLVRINRFEEALPFARKVCDLHPREAAFQNTLATVEARLGDWESAKPRFEKVIHSNPQPEQAARAQQELVNVLDRLGRYEESFDTAIKAKALYSQMPKVASLDKRHVFRTIANNKAGYPAGLLTRWSSEDFADSLPTPVFLMGFLRSGTTLTEQILAAHPDIVSSDENELIYGLAHRIQELSGCPADDIPSGLRQLDLEQARELRRHYWRRVGEEYKAFDATKHRFINKVALNSIEIGLIASLFPEARILFALRDPRDVCLSCFQQSFRPSLTTVNLADWQGIAQQYAAVMDLWLTIKPLMRPRCLALRYENTVADLQGSMSGVFDFLSLPWSGRIASFHEKAKGRYISTPSHADVSQPVYQRSIARWRNYRKQIQTIHGFLAPSIEAFGYENA